MSECVRGWLEKAFTAHPLSKTSSRQATLHRGFPRFPKCLFSLNVVSVAVGTACRFGTENCEGVCRCEVFGACSPVLCRHVPFESLILHFGGVLLDVGDRAELISSDALLTPAQSSCHCPVLSAYREFEWFLWGRPHPLQRVHLQ